MSRRKRQWNKGDLRDIEDAAKLSKELQRNFAKGNAFEKKHPKQPCRVCGEIGSHASKCSRGNVEAIGGLLALIIIGSIVFLKACL